MGSLHTRPSLRGSVVFQLGLSDACRAHAVQSYILRSLAVNSRLKHCGLQKCGFSPMGGGVLFNAEHPEGVYRLDLKDPRARQV